MGRGYRMLDVGARAPDICLQDLEGSARALPELLTNGPVVLAFFKVSCPVCQFTLPFLERIHQNRAPGSLSVYAVSQNNGTDTRDFCGAFGITFPTLLDTEDSGYPASNAFGLTHVPSIFLVEPDGVISWTMEGFGRSELEALGKRAAVIPFRAGERVPELKAG